MATRGYIVVEGPPPLLFAVSPLEMCRRRSTAPALAQLFRAETHASLLLGRSAGSLDNPVPQ